MKRYFLAFLCLNLWASDDSSFSGINAATSRSTDSEESKIMLNAPPYRTRIPQEYYYTNYLNIPHKYSNVRMIVELNIKVYPQDNVAHIDLYVSSKKKRILARRSIEMFW